MPEPVPAPQNAECVGLGPPDFPKPKFDTQLYGWSRFRFDVEHGTVINAELLESSPSKLFDAENLAFIKAWHFPTLRSARGCLWSQKWG